MKILLGHFGRRVRFVFRHFPLREVHPHAELAAEAAEAAGAQSRFWAMHDLLFQNQRDLNAGSLRRYAEEAKIDLRRDDAEMDERAYAGCVQEDIDGGTRSRVRSTPTFFVNGDLRDVSFGLERLQEAIENELAGRTKR